MSVNQNKTTVLSWLLLSMTGVVASWASLLHGQFEFFYSLPTVASTVMLMWIRQQRSFYAQPFYRISWQISIVLICLLVIPGCYFLATEL